MNTTILSIERRADGVFSEAEQHALLGFLGGYSGLTREAYALDLRQFAAWCQRRQLALFDVARHDIESFARQLEDLGRARATIARGLCTITSLYRYAVEEGLIERSPAAHVRRPRLDYESNATGLDRNEVGAMLVAAGLVGASDHALISLLALNGLRVSEAIGADIEQLGLERGHRTLVVLRKGGKTVTVPLAPRTARAIDLVIGERSEGPILLARDGHRLDRHGAARIVRRTARRAGINKRVGPHTLRHAFITAAWTPVYRCATCRKRPATPTHAPPCATTAPASPSTDTPHTSSPPSSPAHPDSPTSGRSAPEESGSERPTAIDMPADAPSARPCTVPSLIPARLECSGVDGPTVSQLTLRYRRSALRTTSEAVVSSAAARSSSARRSSGSSRTGNGSAAAEPIAGRPGRR